MTSCGAPLAGCVTIRSRRPTVLVDERALFGCWNAGVLVGALGGTSVGDPHALGLDAAFPAGLLAWPCPPCVLAARGARIPVEGGPTGPEPSS